MACTYALNFQNPPYLLTISGTKGNIKLAALKLFNDKGVCSLTTNHISEEMGISPGNLYYHYKNKESIIREIHRDMIGDFRDTFYFSSEKNIADAFVNMLLAHAEIYYKYRFFYLDLPALLRRDKALATMHARNISTLIPLIDGMAESIIKSTKPSYKYDPKDLKNVLQSGIVLTEFWLCHLFSAGIEVNEKTVKGFIHNYFTMIKPYLSSSTSDEIEKRIKKELK